MLEQRLRGQEVAAAPILEIVLFFHGQSTWESVRTACFSKVASINFFGWWNPLIQQVFIQ